MINQRPSDRQDNEQRGLARRQERGLSQYEGYVSPFEMMRRFSEDVDRLFGGFGFSSFPFDAGRSLARTGASGGTGFTSWSPSVDVFTRDNDLVVAAEVPGMKPEDVNVEIEGNNLIIQGQTRAEKENREQNQNFWYTERRYGSFYRTIPLPEGVNPDNAKANFNNGVLEITFPDAVRNLQPQRKRIQIQGATGSNQQQTQTGTQQGAQNQQSETQR